MRRSSVALGSFLLASIVPTFAAAQQDRLEGRWEGTVQSPQGQRQAVATFKKSGDGYAGTITGRGNTEMQFKEVKLAGDKVTALAQVDAPQGPLVIKYEFVLQGNTLKGRGEVDFGGQTFAFDYDLKRAGDSQAQANAPSQQQPPREQTQQRQSRPVVPQPQQKQSLDYFVGQWSFKWMGRESPLTPGGSVEGTVSFALIGDGKFLESRTEAKSESGILKESAVIGFDEARKVLAFFEHRSGGIEILSLGDWSSPIVIRFDVAPIKVKGLTLRLKRIISVISAHSFSMTEELSENGGPFLRLGNAIFTKVMPASPQD